MAKKRHIPTEKRYGTVTPEALQNCATLLAEMSAALEALNKKMKAGDLDSLTVDGATKWSRGIKLLSDYQGHVEKAVRNASLEVH